MKLEDYPNLKKIVYNDFNPLNYNLFRCVINHQRLLEECEKLTVQEKNVIPTNPICSENFKLFQNEIFSDGFDFGNSPYVYIDNDMRGKTVVLTTTNGTKAIDIAKNDATIVIGCLNNLQHLCDWLIKQHKNTLILASGWKDKVNLEDTICGGAIADILIESRKFRASEDSTVAAKFIYKSAKEHLWSFLRASSHRRRLIHLKIQKDVKYCLTSNTVPCIPILRNGALVKLEE